MSPKELSYIKDTLSHEKHMKTKCTECANQIQDADIQQLANTHQKIFDQFYQLL
jgi:hypothetical protein